MGDPQVTDASTGATVTSADFSVSTTGTDTYAITVAPGESLGAQSPSVTAALTDGSTQSASTSVNVTDPFATTNSASPATLTADTMNVSFLASPNTPAYWNIDLTTAGDELSLDLGNLPADYDLVLYGPATSSLSGTPSGDTAEVTETPPPDQSTLGQQTDPNEGTFRSCRTGRSRPFRPPAGSVTSRSPRRPWASAPTPSRSPGTTAPTARPSPTSSATK